NENMTNQQINKSTNQRKWPCYFTPSDTTGEKDFEEFFTENENLDLKTYENIGIIKNDSSFDCNKLNLFTTTIQEMKQAKKWTKSALVNLFKTMLPNFDYEDKGKYLDSKM
ncbi:MAG: hypothetical protein PHD00_06675, partial [Bacteroidales bacterium]|nr:hypothetical protein [Bacteroidales bacterium]